MSIHNLIDIFVVVVVFVVTGKISSAVAAAMAICSLGCLILRTLLLLASDLSQGAAGVALKHVSAYCFTYAAFYWLSNYGAK